MGSLKVFGIGPTQTLAKEVCQKLGIELSTIDEEKFPDGELKVRPCARVENANVFVFHSLGGDNIRTVNDRLCELYFFLSTLRDLGALSVTAVIPYLSYARSDQRKGPFDSIILRYVAQMLEGSGVHRIISMDVHNISAFENAFRCPALNLEAVSLFCQHLVISKDSLPVVLSPDIGGIKRAEIFRKQLENLTGIPVDSAFLEKFRTPEGVTGHKLVGAVSGRTILIVDDMISTGETIFHALDACHKEGAGSIKVFATHGLFTKNQNELLNSPLVDEFIVTDSHPALKDLAPFKKLRVLSCASLFAEAISSRGCEV
ncbi:MAG: ribose-phosphate diphosphokinase [Bacteriovorax sp.]|nr:ribose-phosphate diphosphokinase [Bacteriovorax sp.]